MSTSAIFALVLAAFGHSLWNLLTKRSYDKHVFVVLAVVVGVVLLSPFAWARSHPIDAVGWGIVFVSGMAQLVYYLLLGGAYARGDMSVVYPLSRGSSPLFVTLIAMMWQGERPSALGALGIVLIVMGVYLTPLTSLRLRELFAPLASLRNRASQLALLTGVTIAAYSAIDKVGVQHVDPVYYYFLVLVVSIIGLLPYLWLRKREATMIELRGHWRSILVVGATIVAGYLVILFVLQTSPVAYTTSVRGISVVFGALMGVLVLKEKFTVPKLAGALLMFAGVACIGMA
jgi:drug/metabolite transporter (DMT)-like permease